MSEPKDWGLGAWLWRRPRRWYLLGVPIGGVIALVVGVVFTGGFVGGLKLTESNRFCTSCHEMDAPFQEYSHSLHYSNALGVRATCGNCHIPPTFLAGIVKHIQASSQAWGHLTGELGTILKNEETKGSDILEVEPPTGRTGGIQVTPVATASRSGGHGGE